MGSSTKKHKKDKDKEKERDKDKDRDRDTRKRKHRDSEDDDQDRDRDRELRDKDRDRDSHKEKKHKKDKRKDKKRDKGKDSDGDSGSASPDVREVPVDSHLKPPPSKRSKDAEVEERVLASNSESLSIDETNRLRAKLGLKPLRLEEEVSAEDGKIKDDLGEFYHRPAGNISNKKMEEKLRSKISEKKDKRLIEQKLLNVKALGDSDDSDGDAAVWVDRNRKIVKEKEEAAKRAAILDELDAEFGIGNIAAEDEMSSRHFAYTSDSLRGLKVQHDPEAFVEGRNVILTLEDKEVLSEDVDVLVNVNMKDNDRYLKSNENKKKALAGYNPYEHADDFDKYGMPIDKNVLGKYDEEIHGTKKPDGFTIGDEDGLEAKKFKQMMIKEKLSSKRLESLVLPELKIASEYYTEDEIKAKFKKPKKKGKMRSKMNTNSDTKQNLLITDDTEIMPDSVVSVKIDPEEDENDTELELALAKARRLKLMEQQKLQLPKVEDLIATIKTEDEESFSSSGKIVLDSTAEFCRTLGDIPTYGQAGNRDVDITELMEIEKLEPVEKAPKAESSWNSVDIDMEQSADVAKVTGTALVAEPALGSGLSGALKLALSKGYLEKGREVRTAPPSLQHLHANHYSIEDKAHGEEDKFSRRERGYSGPISDFKEKEAFRPNVKLDYVDDEGKSLTPKEAFRYLSHKFHGKGPGKNKQEKRIKQSVQESLMKKMSSNDTPLGTLALLQARQKEAKTAFVVLSGSKAPRNGPL